VDHQRILMRLKRIPPLPLGCLWGINVASLGQVVESSEDSCVGFEPGSRSPGTWVCQATSRGDATPKARIRTLKIIVSVVFLCCRQIREFAGDQQPRGFLKRLGIMVHQASSVGWRHRLRYRRRRTQQLAGISVALIRKLTPWREDYCWSHAKCWEIIGCCGDGGSRAAT